MTHAIMAFVLEAQEIPSNEGLQRAIVWLPNRCQILHLGVIPGTDHIAVWALAPVPPKNEAGETLPYPKKDLYMMEFVVTALGHQVPPTGYKYRAPVRVKNPEGQEAIIFLFEKESSGLLVVGGKGGIA